LVLRSVVLTRLSKKLEKFKAAIDLYFGYYNVVMQHDAKPTSVRLTIGRSLQILAGVLFVLIGVKAGANAIEASQIPILAILLILVVIFLFWLGQRIAGKSSS
jgi:hypothetical protein